MKVIWTLFALLLNFFPLQAQQPSFFVIGKEQFEGVQIYGVIQDKDRNYWFATDQGIYKYDNYNFKKIECEGVKGQSVFGFFINRAGVIFCHNLNHQILKIENNQCSVFYELLENERSSDISLAITDQDELLVLARIPIIFGKDGKFPAKYNLLRGSFGFPFYGKDGRIIAHILETDSILEIKNKRVSVKPIHSDIKKLKGQLTFFNLDGQDFAISNREKVIYTFDENTYGLREINRLSFIQKNEFLRFYNIGNQLWMAGVASGVWNLQGSRAQNYSEQMYKDYFISHVYRDAEGNLLLCTFNQGILVIPDQRIQDVMILPEKQTIVSVHYDQELGMLLGSLNGELITAQNSTYKTISKAGKKPLQTAKSWSGFPYVIYDDGQVKAYHKPSGKIVSLFEGSLKDAARLDSHTVYLALNSGVNKVSVQKGHKFTSDMIQQLRIRTYAIEVEPISKKVFVATADGLKIIKADDSVETFTYNNGGVFVNDLFATSNTLYAATKKNGILMIRNGKVQKKLQPSINQEELEVYKLIIRGEKIYANTSRGFVVLDTNGVVLGRLNKVQGFATNKISDFEVFNNEIWLIHSRGFQKISTQQLNVPKEKPLMEITQIDLNDKPIDRNVSKTEFSSEERKIRFTLSSPTFRNKESIRYHYRLFGYEDGWQTADYVDNRIAYNALAPGKYIFKVKAENGGVYSDTKEFAFSIRPPFYWRWWFIATEFLIFFVTISVFYKWQLNVQRKKSEQQNELNASKLTALQSQMNPHFIFNSLNSIQDLVLKGDVENSYSYITTFSNMVRRTLDYSDKDFIDFEQEILLLELYLSLEKLRFKKDFEYIIDIGNTEDVLLPPLIIQPFIENSLVHGLLHKEGLKKLLIAFQLQDHTLLCTIEDNGVGRAKAMEIRKRKRSDHQSFSGKAIRHRFEILSDIYAGEFGYDYMDLLENGKPLGTKVILKIPIRRKF